MTRPPPSWKIAALVLAAVLLAVGSASTANAAPRARTGGTISGTVLRPDGVTPAAGATVTAYQLDPALPYQMSCVTGTARGSTTTDANGAYRLTGLPADDDYRVLLRPSDPTLAISWVDDDALSVTFMHAESYSLSSGQTRNLGASTLWLSATLRGTVLEAGSLTPLAGMAVTLQFQGPGQIMPVVPPSTLPGSVVTPVLTGADGTFTFGQVPPTAPASGPDDDVVDPGGGVCYHAGVEYGTATLYSWVEDPTGWHTSYQLIDEPWDDVLVAGSTVERDPFVLAPAGKLSGVVRDARGRGVPGIQIVALHAVPAPWDPSGYQWTHDGADYAMLLTDAKGRFSMSVTPGIALRIEARDSSLDNSREAPGAWATEYWPDAPVPQLGASIVVQPLTSFALPTPFVLERGASMSGIVTALTPGVPYGDLFAHASMLVDGTWYPLTYTYVYDDGWYGFYGLPAGTYRVSYPVNLEWADGLYYTEEWPEKPDGEGSPIVLTAGQHRYGIDEWLDPVVLQAKWYGDLGAGVQIISTGGADVWQDYDSQDGVTVVSAAVSSSGGPYAVEIYRPGGPPEQRPFPDPLMPGETYVVWLNSAP